METDMVYLARGGSWLTLDNLFTSAITFLIAIAFANYLPKDVYGTYKFVLSVGSILAIPTLQGISTAVTKSVAQGYGGSLMSALKTRIKWGLLTTVASFCVSIYYFINENIELTLAFAIVAFAVPLKQSLSLYFSALTGKKEFKLKTKYDIGGRMFSGLLLVISILLSNSLFVILLSYFIPWIASHAYLFYRTTKHLDLSEKIDTSMTRYGKHLSIMDVIGTIANQLDKVLIFHFTGAAQVAIYSFALAPVDQIRGLIKPIHSLAMPKFSNRDKAEVRSTIFSKIIKLVLLIAIMVAIYILLAPFFFEIFFPQYMDSIKLSQILAISVIFTGNLPKTFFDANEMIKEQYKMSLFSGVSKITLIGALTFLYGIWGTVMAILVSRTLIFLYSIWLINSSQ